MLRFLLPFLLEVVLVVAALVSCLSAEEDEIRGLPRILWVLIILLLPVVGSIVWFIAGRPMTSRRSNRPFWRVGGGFPESARPRPLAPDDDPEFLRSLRTKQQPEDVELLKQWEADLRRREEELRRRQNRNPSQDQDPGR